MSLIAQIVITSILASFGLGLVTAAAIMIDGPEGLGMIGLAFFMAASVAWTDVRRRWAIADMLDQADLVGKDNVRSIS